MDSDYKVKAYLDEAYSEAMALSKVIDCQGNGGTAQQWRDLVKAEEKLKQGGDALFTNWLLRKLKKAREFPA